MKRAWRYNGGASRLGCEHCIARRSSWCDSQGVEHLRMSDLPVRADASSVIVQQSITWAKASPSSTMIARLLEVDGHGGERLLGEYTFHHTRTIPGPPGDSTTAVTNRPS